MNKRTEAKLTDLSGMQKAINAILQQAWERGRKYEQNKERPQGEWIVKSNGTTNYYACDKCGNAGDIQDKFCRECGADMRKGDKE